MKKIFIYGIGLALLTISACNSQSTESLDKVDDAIEETNEGNGAAEINTNTDMRDDQNVFFPNLEEGQEITLPFVLEFGVNGMKVEPAGPINTDMGHHHVLLDSDPTPAGKMVPANETNVHFGGGQTSDTLQISKYPTLTPGAHTLTLQFANGIHTSYGPDMSKTINIIVK